MGHPRGDDFQCFPVGLVNPTSDSRTESLKLLKNWNVFLKVLLLILIVADGACTFLHLNGWWLLLQLTHPFLDEAEFPQKIYTSSRAFTCKSQSHMSFGEVTSPNTQVHCPGRTAQDCAPFL